MSPIVFQFEVSQNADSEQVTQVVQTRLSNLKEIVEEADVNPPEQERDIATVTAAVVATVILVRSSRELVEELRKLIQEIKGLVNDVQELTNASVEVEGKLVPVDQVTDTQIEEIAEAITQNMM